MTRIKLITHNILVIASLYFSQAYAYGTAICPPVNTITCEVESWMAWYSSTAAPGDWSGGLVENFCMPSESFTFYWGKVGKNLVWCAYKFPNSGDGYLLLRSDKYYYYKKTGEKNCDKTVDWYSPLETFDYSVSCNAHTSKTN